MKRENEKQMGNSKILKFRAWDGQNNKMVTTGKFDSNHAFAITDTGHVYIHGHLMNDKWDIMQYTGLKDKNGVEDLYDKDICKTDSNRVGIVEWHDERGAWIFNDGYNDYLHNMINFITKIGNEHENPELLK